jgi:hypothetical protein
MIEHRECFVSVSQLGVKPCRLIRRQGQESLASIERRYASSLVIRTTFSDTRCIQASREGGGGQTEGLSLGVVAESACVSKPFEFSAKSVVDAFTVSFRFHDTNIVRAFEAQRRIPVSHIRHTQLYRLVDDNYLGRSAH